MQNKIDSLCVDYGESTGYEEPFITLPSMVDDVIALLEIAFNDDGVLFSWIYDRNFGKIKGDYMNLPEEVCSINDVDTLYDYLTANMESVNYVIKR